MEKKPTLWDDLKMTLNLNDFKKTENKSITWKAFIFALKRMFQTLFIIAILLSIPWVLQPPSTCGCMTGCYNPKYAPTITYVYTGNAIPIGELNPAAMEASFFGVSDLPESVLKQNAKQQTWENHRGRMRQILGY